MSNDYYPLEDDPKPEKWVTRSVRLSAEEYSKVQFMADLWNALDKARKLKKSRKWKPSSVLARLFQVGIAGFEARVGPIPADSQERKEMIRRSGEVIEKLRSGKK